MYSLYSFIYYPQTPATVGHWSLTCPPQYSDRMVLYLEHHGCKFNKKMQRRAWQKSVIQDRDIFTIEYAPAHVVKALIKSTQDKGGLVVGPKAEVDVCVRYDCESDREILEIKIANIPDLRDIPCLDEQLICKISPILSSGLKLFCYYPQEQEQASHNVVRVLKILGFYESDGCLRCDF